MSAELDEGWESGLEADHSIEVEITDNPVVARLLGPDGEPILEIHERPVVPFGFGRWSTERG